MVKNILNFFKKQEPEIREEKIINEIVVHEYPIGSSGTEIYSGYIQEDYLQNMRGMERADTYDKMRRGDYNVKMILGAVKNPIKSATWDIEPADDSIEAEKDADLIKFLLFEDLEQTFENFLGEALTVIDFGHSVFEITHKVGINNPNFKNYIGIQSLSWRNPRTIDRWNVDNKTEKLISISQMSSGDVGKLVDIPAEYLMVFNIEQEGANYEGISMLRPAYGNYFRKNIYLKLNAAGIEKYAIPSPVVEVPVGKENSPEFARLKLVLTQYCSHQSNYLTIPAGWKIDFARTGQGFDPSKVEVSIDNEDKRMTKAFLANFLELGMNSVGAYSLSNDLSDFFLSGLNHIAGGIASKINRQLIPQLIRLNVGPRKSYPKLICSNIADKAGIELAQIFSQLVSSNIIIPDDNLEDNVRKRFRLPKRSTEGQRTNQPAVQPQPTENQFFEKFKRAGIKLWQTK